MSIVVQAITMTSLELVDFINQQRKEGEAVLRHADFLTKVPLVLGGGERNFSSTYRDSQNKERPCYRFPKREACLMAMSYSYELQAKVFDRMTELEAQQTPKVPQTYAQALLEAGRLAQLAEEQAQQLALAAPKVAFVDKYVQATGLFTFREVAKLLKANEARFREFLLAQKIMYRLGFGGDLTAYQNHADAGRFEVKTNTAKNGHSYKRTMFTTKGVHWVAGQWAKHQEREVASASGN